MIPKTIAATTVKKCAPKAMRLNPTKTISNAAPKMVNRRQWHFHRRQNKKSELSIKQRFSGKINPLSGKINPHQHFGLKSLAKVFPLRYTEMAPLIRYVAIRSP
jgi:hypothetical protein